MQMNSYSEITPEILDLAQMSERASQINADLYKKYDVKRGLRDINGKGVLAGLTEIGEVQAYKSVDGKEVPCEGKIISTADWILRNWCRASYPKNVLDLKKLPTCSFLESFRAKRSFRISASFWALTVRSRLILCATSS